MAKWSILLPLLLAPLAANAQRTIDALSPPPPVSTSAAAPSPPLARGILRSRSADIHPALLSPGLVAPGDVLHIRAFDDLSLACSVHSVQTLPIGIQTIRADVPSSPGGFASFTQAGGDAMAVVHLPEIRRRISIRRPNGSSSYLVEELDPSLYRGLPPADPLPAAAGSSPRAAPGSSPKADGDTPIDLLFAYTPAARAWANQYAGGISNRLAQSLSVAQQAADNSNLGVQFRLVHALEVQYVEDPDDIAQSLDRLKNPSDGHMDDLHSLRDFHGADQVTLFSLQDDYGGMAYLLNSTNGTPDWAFAVVRVQQADGDTFAHEFGHNLGCHHRKDQPTAPGPGLFSYSAGWRWIGTNSTRYCSVMSYSDDWDSQPVESVLHFSNPSVQHSGQPTGHAADADNARTFRQTKTVVAGYRSSVSRILRLSGNGSFPLLPVGQSSAQSFAIHNDGNGTLSVSEIAYPAGFSGAWTGAIPPGASQTVQIVFAPLYPGAYSGNADVRSDKTFGTNLLALSGSASPVDSLFISISSPAAQTAAVDSASAAFSLQGVAGTSIVGRIRWSNSLSGASGDVPASTLFSVDSIPLAVGANPVSVSGTNSPAPGGTLAQDNAANPPYSDGWNSGDSGGSGLGPWSLSADGAAGHWRATQSGNSNLDSAAHAWGLWANSGGLSSASRAFASPLLPGNVFRLKFENGWIDPGASVGFALRNANDEYLLEFMFGGGDARYRLNDAFENRDSGIPWSENGLDVSVEITSPSTYLLRAGATSVSGHLKPRADPSISSFRAWNFSAGSGDAFNLYLADLAVTNEFGLPSTVSDSVSVLRPPPPSLSVASSPDAISFSIPSTATGRLYHLEASSNLVDPVWFSLSNSPGTGDPWNPSIPFSPDLPRFFRSRIVPTP